MKLTLTQIKEADGIAQEIARLETLRANACDSEVAVKVGHVIPTAANPLGLNVLGSLPVNSENSVIVTVAADSIRMAIHNKLTPLYTRMRELGIELEV